MGMKIERQGAAAERRRRQRRWGGHWRAWRGRGRHWMRRRKRRVLPGPARPDPASPVYLLLLALLNRVSS